MRSLSEVLNIQSTAQRERCPWCWNNCRPVLGGYREETKLPFLLLSIYIVLHSAVAGCARDYARYIKLEVEYMLVKVAVQLSTPTYGNSLWNVARRLSIWRIDLKMHQIGTEHMIVLQWPHSYRPQRFDTHCISYFLVKLLGQWVLVRPVPYRPLSGAYGTFWSKEQHKSVFQMS